MRIVVVGGGVIGLLTAIECVRAGARIDLVDQASIPSPSATSNDRHRVIRALHRGDAPLTRAAARAHDGWLGVERQIGARFYHQVGALTAMPVEDVAANLAMLVEAGATAWALTPDELSTRYTRIRFPAGLGGVAEPAAGAVLADRALAAMAGWLGNHPAVQAHPHRRVVDIDETGAVRLTNGTVVAGDRVVVAAGPWSRDLLPATLSADLTLYRQTMLSYTPVPSRKAWAGMPAIPAIGTANGAWLMPPVADTPVRLSAASACRVVAEMTDRVTPDYWREHLIDHFRTLLVDFDRAAVIGATEGYYLSHAASGGPLLATLGDGAVCAYAACGGMSFKFAPLIARAIADRALGRTPRPTGLPSIDQPRAFTAAGGQVVDGQVVGVASTGDRDAGRPRAGRSSP